MKKQKHLFRGLVLVLCGAMLILIDAGSYYGTYIFVPFALSVVGIVLAIVGLAVTIWRSGKARKKGSG